MRIYRGSATRAMLEYLAAHPEGVKTPELAGLYRGYYHNRYPPLGQNEALRRVHRALKQHREEGLVTREGPGPAHPSTWKITDAGREALEAT